MEGTRLTQAASCLSISSVPICRVDALSGKVKNTNRCASMSFLNPEIFPL